MNANYVPTKVNLVAEINGERGLYVVEHRATDVKGILISKYNLLKKGANFIDTYLV